MFHAKNNWYFERQPSGLVRIVKREGEKAANPILVAVTLTPEMWASIVASVSEMGETGQTFRAALMFHNGELEIKG
jgi:hypothetical protein